MIIPYALILLLASLALGFMYAARGDASWRSKLGVAAIVAGSLVVWWSYPQWIIIAILLQLGASIFVLVHFKLNPRDP